MDASQRSLSKISTASRRTLRISRPAVATARSPLSSPTRCIRMLWRSGTITRAQPKMHRRSCVRRSCRKTLLKPIASSSIDFGDLATTQSKATWWSPGPANASANIADVFMLRDLEKTNRLGELPRAWLGELVDVKHKLVICYCNDPLPGQTTYYHALYSWPTSGVFLWPLTVRPHRWH